MMTLTDNPRVDIEKRIKQLERRRKWLIAYSSCSIDYENGIAVRLYPNLRPKVNVARELVTRCNRELTKLWKDLKSF